MKRETAQMALEALHMLLSTANHGAYVEHDAYKAIAAIEADLAQQVNDALKLADEIEGSVNNPQLYWQGKAASTLRQLHARNSELLEALESLFAASSPEIGGAPGSPLERARAAIAKVAA